MVFKISKAVRPGMIVVKRGDKYIRCGRRAKGLIGVYQDANSLTIIGVDGVTHHEIPRGVVLQGRMDVLTAKEQWAHPTWEPALPPPTPPPMKGE